jgi:hypothetical protein
MWAWRCILAGGGRQIPTLIPVYEKAHNEYILGTRKKK